jgi:branched-chain amino acid transport system substrate-binding protein
VSILLLIGIGAPALAKAEQPLRIAVIDTLSGPFAKEGDAMVRHLRFVADRVNAQGGVLGRTIEIVPFDNKGSPQETLIILRDVVDQGIGYVAQGNGSHVAGALVEAIDKHNERNPEAAVLFLNYSALNPELTNELCSFWHFRFDANTEMRLDALTDYMAGQDRIRKVFLINQDYAHGHQVAGIARRMLASKAPDVEVVGDVLHPIGKVRDFSPYIARIRNSGADAVVTGNWGNDLSLLVRAGAEAGVDVEYYTFYAGGFGVPTAMGAAGNDKVFQVTEWHPDVPDEENTPEVAQFARDFAVYTRQRVPWYFHRTHTLIGLLVEAMEKAKTTRPLAVAQALEELRYPTAYGPARMRAEDHQLLQPLFISRFSEDALHETENSGHGWVTVGRIAAEQTALPSTCAMRRP